MVHNEKFKMDQTVTDDIRTIMMRGIIDEDTSFDPIGHTEGEIIINFKGVTAINSCGVRNWVNLIKSMSERDIFYEECPPLIVRQMNMVPSFVSHAQVISVFAAYVCDKCDDEKLILINHKAFKNSANIPEAMPCDSCEEGEMEFDGLPQQYFAFAK